MSGSEEQRLVEEALESLHGIEEAPDGEAALNALHRIAARAVAAESALAEAERVRFQCEQEVEQLEGDVRAAESALAAITRCHSYARAKEIARAALPARPGEQQK